MYVYIVNNIYIYWIVEWQANGHGNTWFLVCVFIWSLFISSTIDWTQCTRLNQPLPTCSCFILQHHHHHHHHHHQLYKIIGKVIFNDQQHFCTHFCLPLPYQTLGLLPAALLGPVLQSYNVSAAKTGIFTLKPLLATGDLGNMIGIYYLGKM